MHCVALRKPLVTILLPVLKMQSSVYEVYTLFQVARSVCPFAIHRLFRLSTVIQLVAISQITYAQPTMFPMLKSCKERLLVLFSLVQISRRDPSHPRFKVLWWAPGLTMTQRKLHPYVGDSYLIVVAVATENVYSARHNTSQGIGLLTPSCLVNPLNAISGFLCIDTSQICVHHLNPRLES